jgi:hypothetical protein
VSYPLTTHESRKRLKSFATASAGAPLIARLALTKTNQADHSVSELILENRILAEAAI